MLDEQLISKIKAEACDQSLNKLISKHTGLCYDIYKKYLPSQEISGSYSINIENDKDYIIYKSALSFDETKKIKFSTWLGNQVRYQCLNLLKKKKKVISCDQEGIELASNKNEDILFEQENKERNKSLVEYVTSVVSKMKDPRIKQIFEMRYFSKNGKKTSWQKIGSELDISAQTAINIHERALKLIRKKINSDNLSDHI
mgnify:FL=1|jgi:RNA polymerase sigma factor (sigma-70 family)